MNRQSVTLSLVWEYFVIIDNLLHRVKPDNIEIRSLTISHITLITLNLSCEECCVYCAVIFILCLCVVSPRIYKFTEVVIWFLILLKFLRSYCLFRLSNISLRFQVLLNIWRTHNIIESLIYKFFMSVRSAFYSFVCSYHPKNKFM